MSHTHTYTHASQKHPLELFWVAALTKNFGIYSRISTYKLVVPLLSEKVTLVILVHYTGKCGENEVRWAQTSFFLFPSHTLVTLKRSRKGCGIRCLVGRTDYPQVQHNSRTQKWTVLQLTTAAQNVSFPLWAAALNDVSTLESLL